MQLSGLPGNLGRPGALQADDITKGDDGAMWFSLPGINAVGRIDLTTYEITQYQIPTSNIPGVNGVGVDGVLHIITHGPNNTVLFAEPLSNKIATLNVFTKVFSEYTIPTTYGGWGYENSSLCKYGSMPLTLRPTF